MKKGYSQLMQSNSIAPPAAVKIGEIKRLDNATNKSDTLLKNTPVKADPLFSNILNNIDTKNKSIDNLNGQITAKGITAKEKTDLQNKIANLNIEKRNLFNKLKQLQDDTKPLFDRYNDLVIEKYSAYIKALDDDLKTYKKGIGNDRKNAISKFDKIINSKVIQNQKITSLQASQIDSMSYIIEYKLDTVIIPQRNKINAYLQNLKQYKIDLEKYKIIKDTIYKNVEAGIKKLDAEAEAFKDSRGKFLIEYNSYVDKFNKYIDSLNLVIKKIEKDNETEATEAERLSALGGINKIFGDHGAVIPNVTIVGSKKFVTKEQSSIYGEAKLFIAAGDEDKKNPGVNKLFIPEASTIGFMTDFTFGFIAADNTAKFNSDFNHYEQKLSINLGVYYLGKKLQPDTLTSFNTTVFHVKLGLEYIIIPHAITAYFNTNQLLVVTNTKTFEKYYPDAKRIRSFTSFGIQSYLNLNDKHDFHLLINLGFVNVNNDVNTWMQTLDSVIPTVKLSLVKSFAF
jgi:hypothetical protein